MMDGSTDRQRKEARVYDRPDDDTRTGEDAGTSAPAPVFQALTLDIDRYQGLLDDLALLPEQREDLIRALWEIICGFVDLGFRVSPLQQSCGDVDTSIGRAAVAMVSCGDPNTQIKGRTNGAAAPGERTDT